MGSVNDCLLPKNKSTSFSQMLKSLNVHNRSANFHDTWYVAFVTSAHHMSCLNDDLGLARSQLSVYRTIGHLIFFSVLNLSHTQREREIDR